MSGKGKRLSESQRLEIITALSDPGHPSKRSLARKYDVDEKAIQKVWENREAIRKRSALMSEESKRKQFRASVGRFSELEDMLYLWVDSMRRASLPVPPSLAILKAKQIAEQLSISENDFKASWQWLSRFRARKGLQKVLLHGEGAEIDKENPELLAALNDLYATIAQYDPENVYNMDETGLFFRLLPSEDVSTTRGKKKAKERLSLVVCANATGTHKVPCALIGKPKFPACIKNRKWPLKYLSQGKAWMDVDTCWKWFNEVFYPEVKKRTGRRVLLLMDNAPGHFSAFERNNVKVAFFPPNCTSWKQPCDMGIIAALKKRYRYLYLKDVLSFYELDNTLKERKQEQAKRLPRGAAGVDYGKTAHLLDAANYVNRAWDSISESAIKNSFKKAELLPLECGVVEDVDLMADLLHSLKSLNIAIDQKALEDFDHVDDENNEEYTQVILEDVNEVLVTMQTEKDDASEESSNDTGENDDCTSMETDVIFGGFEHLYKKTLKIEDQLLCQDVQAIAGDSYDNLRRTFESFQKTLRRVALEAKHKNVQNMQQLTMHDMFKHQ